MPSYRLGQELGLFREFLGVVFAEIEVFVRAAVEGEDVIGGF